MLVFVGVTMLLTDVYKVPVGLSLGIIAVVLATAVVASLEFPKEVAARDPVEHAPLDFLGTEAVDAPQDAPEPSAPIQQ